MHTSDGLKVLITKYEGQHRVHVRGNPATVRQVVRNSAGLLFEWRPGVASFSERFWRETRGAWVNSRHPAASYAHSLLRDARKQHLLQDPDCPFRDRGEGSTTAPCGLSGFSRH